MPDILILPASNADDDLTGAIVLNDQVLPATLDIAALGLSTGVQYTARVLGEKETFTVTMVHTASGSVVLAPVVVAGSATRSIIASGAVVLPAVQADGASTVTSPATISEDSWTESTGIWRVFTDQPSNGNWHWARFADGTTGITADGSGGWSSTPQESGTIAVAASGDPIDIPETGTTGTAYELFLYQRNASGGDSNVLTTGYVADNTLPTLGSLATNTAGDTITGTMSETIETPSGQPAVGDFTLGGVAAGSVIDSITFSGTSFTASIASNPAVNGESVTLAYTKGANVVRDLRRNEMASFSAQAVTNNVPASGITLTYQATVAQELDLSAGGSETSVGFIPAAGTYLVVVTAIHGVPGSPTSNISLSGSGLTVTRIGWTSGTGVNPTAMGFYHIVATGAADLVLTENGTINASQGYTRRLIRYLATGSTATGSVATFTAGTSGTRTVTSGASFAATSGLIAAFAQWGGTITNVTWSGDVTSAADEVYDALWGSDSRVSGAAKIAGSTGTKTVTASVDGGSYVSWAIGVCELKAA